MFRTLSSFKQHDNIHTTSDEEMERQREKQKLLNMSMDGYGSYSPLSLTSTQPRYGNTDYTPQFSMYDDPWGINRHTAIHAIKQEPSYGELPAFTPALMKMNSIPINPFHSDVAPSAMLFTDENTVQQQQTQAQAPDMTTLFTLSGEENNTFMSDSEDDDVIEQHGNKRQRGSYNNTIYIKQEQAEDQDIPVTQQDVTSYPQQQPMLCTEPSQHGFIDYTATANTEIGHLFHHMMQDTNNNNIVAAAVPFTLDPQPFTLTSLAHLATSDTPTTASSTRRSSIDSHSHDDNNNNKRKRKVSTSSVDSHKVVRKSQPIGTHAIENTGAPVKMAKYLHVDGLTTHVWIEHAVYEEAGIRTDVRMIMYSGAFNGVVVHAGDVGERIVCNRRSNISREFGQYASPTEKILIRIPSEHRPLGQTGNVLTGYGLIRFLQSKKMRKSENQNYRRWLLHHVYGILQARPFTFPQGHPIETRTTPVTSFTEADFSH